MAADWPPPKNLPPGFPLAAVDRTGRALKVGAKVRIESVASCVASLAPEEQVRVKSYEGKVFEVLQIDRYGMLWFGTESGNPTFSLRPGEVAVT